MTGENRTAAYIVREERKQSPSCGYSPKDKDLIFQKSARLHRP